MTRRERINEVQQWLAENVKVYSSPRVVLLDEFEIDEINYSGTFRVSLDETVLNEKFSFSLGGNGKPELHFPMFHSPLGVPASFLAIKLTDGTTKTIKSLLNSVLPKMKSLGLNLDTGEVVYLTTHSARDRRINNEEFILQMAKITDCEFRVSSAL